MAAAWLGGTAPRKTSVSVPRLTPVTRVRTRTSPSARSGSSTSRISPQPGVRSQKARAVAVIGTEPLAATPRGSGYARRRSPRAPGAAPRPGRQGHPRPGRADGRGRRARRRRGPNRRARPRGGAARGGRAAARRRGRLGRPAHGHRARPPARASTWRRTPRWSSPSPCCWPAPSAPGCWSAGLLRYAFGLAGLALPWLSAPLPPRRSRKVVAAVQGVVLTVAVADLLPRAVVVPAVVVALVALVWSFGRDVAWLAAAARPRRPSNRRP